MMVLGIFIPIDKREVVKNTIFTQAFLKINCNDIMKLHIYYESLINSMNQKETPFFCNNTLYCNLLTGTWKLVHY
jgi:hypothetical protein